MQREKQEREASLGWMEPEAKVSRKRQRAGSVEDGGRLAGGNQADGYVRRLARRARLNPTSEAARRAASGGRGPPGVVARDQRTAARRRAAEREQGERGPPAKQARGHAAGAGQGV